MTSTQGGVMTAPAISGAHGVSDGVGTRKTSTLPNRKGGAASGRLAERPDADTTERDAFDPIYERYFRPIYIYVIRHVTGNRETAEDVTQEVFLNALRGLRKAGWEIEDPGMWLFKIAHNAVIDHHRRVSVRPPEYLVGEVGDDHDAYLPDISDTSVLSARVFAAVRRLSPAHRKLIAFRFLLDLTVPEVAVVLGVSEGTVKSRSYYALRALRRDLGASIDEDLAPSRRAVPTQPTGSGKVPG